MGLSTGFGVNQKKEIAGAPFAAGSANNGLSVDPITGKIVLGNNTGGVLATLLSDRDIPLAGQVLNFTGLNVQAHLNDGGAIPDILLGDAAGINILQIVPSLQIGFWNVTDGIDLASVSLIGQAGGANAILGASNNVNGSSVSVIRTGVSINCNPDFSVNNQITFGPAITANTTTFGVAIGDVNSIANGSRIVLDDVNREFFVFAAPGFAVIDALLDPVNIDVGIGDVNVIANGTFLEVVDNSRTVIIQAVNGLSLSGDTVLLHGLGNTLVNGAGASIGTLTNAPIAGNPTKWVALDDSGVTRYIPCW